MRFTGCVATGAKIAWLANDETETKTGENALVVEYEDDSGATTSETISETEITSVSATSIVTAFPVPMDAKVGATATIKVKIGATTHTGTATVLAA